MQNKIRFGIIGCGIIGKAHAESINDIDSAKLVAVSDIILESKNIWSEVRGRVLPRLQKTVGAQRY